MSGIYQQWIDDFSIKDDHEINLYEKEILSIIKRNTLGYKLMYSYIKQDLFLHQMSVISLKRHRKTLVEKGLIKFKPTNKMSYYELVIPDSIDNEFVFNFVRNPIAYAISYLKQHIDGDVTIDNIKSFKNDSRFNGLYKINEAIDSIIADIESNLIVRRGKIDDSF